MRARTENSRAAFINCTAERKIWQFIVLKNSKEQTLRKQTVIKICSVRFCFSVLAPFPPLACVCKSRLSLGRPAVGHLFLKTPSLVCNIMSVRHFCLLPHYLRPDAINACKYNCNRSFRSLI